MIRFSPHFTMADAAQAANAIGGLLVSDMHGGAVILTPAEVLARAERHGNQGRLPVPSRWHRINQRDLPEVTP